MKPSRQELNTALTQSVSHTADVAVLGVAKKPKRKKIELKAIYQTSENPDLYRLDNAFDILFEETLRQMGDLTTNDN